MRMLTAAVGAAVLILAATPALAGGPRGGGHHPQPPAPCCRGGGGNTNINVNVNAQARASASASARSYFNARPYDVGTFRGGGYGGGVIYAGGGYGGDAGGYVGGPVYYNELALQGPACPSAPFGYIVTGFGRDDHRPSWCGYRYDERGYDRGGRYGYSERRDAYAESRYESYESYEEYEAAAYYEERDPYRDDGYDRDGCDCRDAREPAPYPPPYLPEPPRYEPPRYAPPPPARPRREPPPRQYYRQEPGERG